MCDLFSIRPMQSTDAQAAARLMCALWPENGLEQMLEELPSGEDDAVFLAYNKNEACGFAHVSLRREYVEGASSSPTGYLEGIYVAPEQRGQGIAKALLAACEEWARGRGCVEFASDLEEENTGSYAFHLRAGFKEVNRVICMLKTL